VFSLHLVTEHATKLLIFVEAKVVFYKFILGQRNKETQKIPHFKKKCDVKELLLTTIHPNIG
jgi:hypothetical protein